MVEDRPGGEEVAVPGDWKGENVSGLVIDRERFMGHFNRCCDLPDEMDHHCDHENESVILIFRSNSSVL